MTLRIAELRQANPRWFSKENKQFFGDIDYSILHSKGGSPYLLRSTFMWSDMKINRLIAKSLQKTELHELQVPLGFVYRLNTINPDMSIGSLIDQIFKTRNMAKEWLKEVKE